VTRPRRTPIAEACPETAAKGTRICYACGKSIPAGNVCSKICAEEHELQVILGGLEYDPPIVADCELCAAVIAAKAVFA
jgi:hypothetical protein